MNQILMVVLTAVALISVGVGAMVGLWMGADDSDTTLDEPITVTVFIDHGSGNTTTHEVSTVNATPLGALHEAAMRQNGDFAVVATYYPNYDATLVESIADSVNGMDEMYWQFRVNGDYINVGCDRYRIHDGDLIEWAFEESSW